MIEYELKEGEGPLLFVSIHNGHNIRPELLPYLALKDTGRLREEDPHTAYLAEIGQRSLVIKTSRFETDLNRPPENAVYRKPEDAWGLELYHKPLPEEIIRQSRLNYDNFYREMEAFFSSVLSRQPYLIVYDLHTYNHRRKDIDDFAPPEENPEVNVGTGNTHPKWRPVIDQVLESMRSFNYMGRHLDVRENVKFKGGYFSRWLNDKFGERVCPLAIEFKKFFMNEWTGEHDESELTALRELLISTIHPVIEKANEVKEDEKISY